VCACVCVCVCVCACVCVCLYVCVCLLLSVARFLSHFLFSSSSLSFPLSLSHFLSLSSFSPSISDTARQYTRSMDGRCSKVEREGIFGANYSVTREGGLDAGEVDARE